MKKRMMYVQRQEKILEVMCRVENALAISLESDKPLTFSPASVAHYAGISNSSYIRKHLKDLAARGLLAAQNITLGTQLLATTYTLTEKGRMLSEALGDLYVRMRE